MGNCLQNKETNTDKLVLHINKINIHVKDSDIDSNIKNLYITIDRNLYETLYSKSYVSTLSLSTLSIKNTNVEILDLSDETTWLLTIKELPCGLKSLFFGKDRGENFTIGHDFGFQEKSFPDSLIDLKINSKFYEKFNDIVPRSLKKLELYELPNQIINFPPNLEVLVFNQRSSFYFDSEIKKSIKKLDKLFVNLPNTLKILKIPNNWNFPLNNLPCGLKKLFLGEMFNQLLDFLPDSLTHLEFFKFNKYSQPLNNLPQGLEYLDLGYCNDYIHPIQNLPNSIKYLKIGKYNIEIKSLPNSLEKLVVGSPVYFNLKKNYDITFKYNGFYELTHFGSYNNKNNVKITIPPNLKEIICYNYLYYPERGNMIVIFPNNLNVYKNSKVDSSVINYKRISNTNNWKLENQTMKKLCDL